MMHGSLYGRGVSVLLLGVSLAACSARQEPAPVLDPGTALQAIPPADPAKYEHMQDMKNWRNPYLVIRKDGVALLDVADNAEIVLKSDELLSALARLPASNWPYGRVVAATETGAGAAEDAVAIRRTKGIVGGILEGAHVAVRWVPAA